MKKPTVYFRIGEAARERILTAQLGTDGPGRGSQPGAISIVFPGCAAAASQDPVSAHGAGRESGRNRRDVTGEPPGGHGKSSGPKRKREAIARRLAQLRRELGMTLAEVARNTGVSISFLSSLERGYSSASIATLQKLARVYKTNILSFFADEENSRRPVRSRDHKVLKPNSGIEMELLASGNKIMAPHLFRITPGAGSGGSYDHEGEEFICVLQGKLEVWLDEMSVTY